MLHNKTLTIHIIQLVCLYVSSLKSFSGLLAALTHILTLLSIIHGIIPLWVRE